MATSIPSSSSPTICPVNSHLRTRYIRYSSCLSFQNGSVWTEKKKMTIKQKHYATSLSPRKVCGYHPVSVSALPFDLSPPPIDHDLLETAIREGAKVSEHGIIETFDNDEEALDAFDNGIVSDLSHFGRIRVEMIVYGFFTIKAPQILNLSVKDRHNLEKEMPTLCSTSLGCDTIFVTPTAQTIDSAHAWIMKTSIMLFVSPMTSENITQMLNKRKLLEKVQRFQNMGLYHHLE